MRSRRSCTGFKRNRCQNVRGEGVPVPPENGFQVKIRLSYPFRDLSFSGLFGAFGGKPLVEQRRCSGSIVAAVSRILYCFLYALQNMLG